MKTVILVPAHGSLTAAATPTGFDVTLVDSVRSISTR